MFLMAACGTKNKAEAFYEHVIQDDVGDSPTDGPTKAPDGTTPGNNGEDGPGGDGKNDDGKNDDGKNDDGKNDDGKDDDGKNGDGKNGDGKNGDGKNGDGENGDGKNGEGLQGTPAPTPPPINDGTFIVDGVRYTVVNETVKIIANRANIRKGPSTDYESVKLALAGDLFKRTGKGDGEWDRLEYEGQHVYVWNEYLLKVE